MLLLPPRGPVLHSINIEAKAGFFFTVFTDNMLIYVTLLKSTRPFQGCGLQEAHIQEQWKGPQIGMYHLIRYTIHYTWYIIRP